MKKILNHLFPNKEEKVVPEHLPAIEVNINNGKVHIDGVDVNYSFGSLHHVFRQAIKFKTQEIAKAKSALILGFGAGSIAKILLDEKNYNLAITGVDFEPFMFDLAKKYSGIKDFSSLDLYTQDAQKFIETNTKKFNVIFIDLFVEDKVPDFCFTPNFFSHLKNSLTENGLIIWNTLSKNDIENKIEALAKEHQFLFVESKRVTKDNLVLYIY